ncbi:MAG TPA: hypothetical protein VI297_00875 [Gemmatimonadales bacterium]
MNRKDRRDSTPLFRRLTVLTAAFVVAAAACNDANAPTGPAPSASTLALASTSTGTAGPSEWLTCGSQTYYKTTQTVGTSGGLIVAGKHSLLIPAGALSKAVKITMESMPDSIVNVRFGPSGLTFSATHQPTLFMTVIGCPVPAGATPRIAYVSDTFSVISLLPSTWNATTFVVSAQLGHFSRYAVHY